LALAMGTRSSGSGPTRRSEHEQHESPSSTAPSSPKRRAAGELGGSITESWHDSPVPTTPLECDRRAAPVKAPRAVVVGDASYFRASLQPSRKPSGASGAPDRMHEVAGVARTTSNEQRPCRTRSQEALRH